jgi:hypothetical protein
MTLHVSRPPSLASQLLQNRAHTVIFGVHTVPVGAGLPAKAISRSMDVSTARPPSLASQLLQNRMHTVIFGVHTVPVRTPSFLVSTPSFLVSAQFL